MYSYDSKIQCLHTETTTPPPSSNALQISFSLYFANYET